MSERIPHPCKGMTRAQRDTFEQIAIGNDGGHHPRVLKALVEAGLIYRYEEPGLVPGLPGATISIHRYAVPGPVHFDWCQWCAENVSDDMLEGQI